MTTIPKGTILEEVVPYAIVPLYDNNSPSADNTAKGCDAGTDPTRIQTIGKLPRWSPCQIWDQKQSYRGFETSEMKKFLRKLRRMASSLSNSVDASWHILCILTVLQVVKENSFDLKYLIITSSQNDRNSPHCNEFSLTQQPGKSDSSSQWWSPLLSEKYDDDKERKMIPVDDDYGDENFTLLVELWPMIRSYIPWAACQRLYRRVQNRMHILTIPHPMTTWAQKTLFDLNDEEFETSWKLFQNIDLQQIEESFQTVSPTIKKTSEDICVASAPPNRLRASKLWLDRVANIPERLVGVLIDDPLKILVDDTSKDVLTNSNSERNIEISTALSLPRCHQSCLPNTCLELYVVVDEEKDAKCDEPPGREQEMHNEIRCKWISLYDLSSSESQIKNRTLSTMPESTKYNCIQYTYESETTTGTSGGKTRNTDKRETVLCKINSTNLVQARRLAHSYFFKEEFEDAMLLYQQCHRYLVNLNSDCTAANKDPAILKSDKAWNEHTEADLWHTIGAVLLSQQKFSQAQQHWKDGSHYKLFHRELSEQLEKQRAYKYFDPLPESLIPPCSHETIISYKEDVLWNISKSKSHSVFTTSNVIDVETCQNLIAWAQEYALNNGGWTASRHYAVPTTDLPIHRVPKLLEWFQEWMPHVLLPTLRDQFGANSDELFYVHDAFLVRYEGTAANCFLPLHFDESTHSCVVALNDDFDGGGSYIYDLNRSIAQPPGAMVSFLGDQCLHGGNPVTRGVRFILAIFLYLDKAVAHNPLKQRDKNTPIETNEKKRKEETIHHKNGISKRSKKVDELGSHKGGGFSFSFF